MKSSLFALLLVGLITSSCSNPITGHDYLVIYRSTTPASTAALARKFKENPFPVSRFPFWLAPDGNDSVKLILYAGDKNGDFREPAFVAYRKLFEEALGPELMKNLQILEVVEARRRF